MKEAEKCCICKKELKTNEGNNPDPIKKKGKCCNKCNWEIVIPARLKKYMGFSNVTITKENN